MSMIHRHFLCGLLGLVALSSCTDDHYYDTPGYMAPGTNPRPYGPSPYAPGAGQLPPGTPGGYGPQPGAPYSPYGQDYPAPNQPGTQTPPGGQISGATTPSDIAPPPPITGTRDYPVARRSPDNPNYVISPFDPKRQIDVTGYASGKLVKDPENRKIFRVP